MSPRKTSLSAFLAPLVAMLLLLCAPVRSYGQENLSAGSATLVQEVKKALGSGDQSIMSRFFGPSVEVQLPNVSGIFSKKQSEMIVGQFLTAHPGLAYDLDHEEVADDATLTIGRASRESEVFRVCIISQQIGNSLQIKQLRIETLK